TYKCFFFSSRRRHTRSKRDWSSDVCSSDLSIFEYDYREVGVHPLDAEKHKWNLYLFLDNLRTKTNKSEVDKILKDFVLVENSDRSEERRVGKESRCRWSKND